MPSSLNSLARELGLSRTTVSDALRGKGRVSPETVRRVKQAAEAAHYRVNPLLATVLGSVRRSRPAATRGAIAAIDLYEADHWPHGAFTRELVTGAKARAAQMGFVMTEFVVGRELSWSRLDRILKSRGISGVILLPSWHDPDLSQLDWSNYAGIYMDHLRTGPELHSVCCDHYGSMQILMSRLLERGYRRPGLLLQRGRDERLQGRQKASFYAFQLEHLAPEDRVPPLIVEDFRSPQADFGAWFQHYQPDVVLSHFADTTDWIEACAPDSATGFVLLNVLEKKKPCAALDLQPSLLGARGAEMLVGQILREEFGMPAWPSRIAVQARWVEGPTLRNARDSVSVGDSHPPLPWADSYVQNQLVDGSKLI